MGKVWRPGVGRFGPQVQIHDGTMAGLTEDTFGERWKHSPKVLECQMKECRPGPGPSMQAGNIGGWNVLGENKQYGGGTDEL